MNLGSLSLRQYGLLVGAALLLFMILSVWWTAPPEDDYCKPSSDPMKQERMNGRQ